MKYHIPNMKLLLFLYLYNHQLKDCGIKYRTQCVMLRIAAVSYLSIKLFKRSKQGAFLGGHGLSVQSSSSFSVEVLPVSPVRIPYRGA